MINILGIFLITALLVITSAYDLFEGLLQQGEPCFGTVDVNDCNRELSQVFSPSYKGANINEMSTKMWLFTTSNPEEAEPIHKCGGKLPDNTKFDPKVDTVIIVHGWLDGVCRTAWMRELKDQLFIRDKYNVILTDWTWGNTIDYTAASFNALVVGEQIAFVILNIMEQIDMYDGERFHLIGHSFGSFVMSTAGKYVMKVDPERIIGRITFLDPAVSPFVDDNPRTKLKESYAKFVDVIHSDGGTCFPVSIGEYTGVGDVDFFPNGGAFQLSCYPYIVPSLLKGDLVYGLGSLLLPALCPHLQAIQYFKVSINHPQGLFVGAQCNSYEEFMSGECKRCCKDDFSKCAVMGMDAKKYFKQPTGNGTYYLNLGLTCPYNEDYEFSIYKDC